MPVSINVLALHAHPDDGSTQAGNTSKDMQCKPDARCGQVARTFRRPPAETGCGKWPDVGAWTRRKPDTPPQCREKPDETAELLF